MTRTRKNSHMLYVGTYTAWVWRSASVYTNKRTTCIEHPDTNHIFDKACSFCKVAMAESGNEKDAAPKVSVLVCRSAVAGKRRCKCDECIFTTTPPEKERTRSLDLYSHFGWGCRCSVRMHTPKTFDRLLYELDAKGNEDPMLAVVAEVCHSGQESRVQYAFIDGMSTLNLSMSAFSRLTCLSIYSAGDDLRVSESALLPPTLELLEIRASELTHVPECIRKCTRLKMLCLSHNELAELPSWITELRALERLMLSDNKFTMFPAVVSEMQALTVLCMRRNLISHVPEKLPPKIEELFLDGTRVSKFPEKIVEYPIRTFGGIEYTTWPFQGGKVPPHLKALFLSGDMDLPSQLDGVNSIEEISISESECREVPNFIRSCRGLTLLSINECRLETLPEWIGELQELEMLDVRYNDISTLPDELYELKKLRELNLSHCRIQRLSPKIENLQALDELDCSSSELEFLPESLVQLRKLKFLDLSKTRIRKLPTDIGNLTELMNIDVAFSNIESLPDSLCKLKNLEALRLHNTSLTSLPSNFGHLAELIELTLDFAPLESLPLSFLYLPDGCSVMFGPLHVVDYPESFEGDIFRLRGEVLVNRRERQERLAHEESDSSGYFEEDESEDSFYWPMVDGETPQKRRRVIEFEALSTSFCNIVEQQRQHDKEIRELKLTVQKEIGDMRSMLASVMETLKSANGGRDTLPSSRSTP